MDLRRQLLWVDCIGGLVAGVLMLALGHWLSAWYRLPQDLMYVIGWVNLAYGSFSLSLAMRPRRPKGLIVLLAVANLIWALFFCLRWAILFSDTASPFGLIHLVGEALWVGGLGCLEWRWRDQLTNA